MAALLMIGVLAATTNGRDETAVTAGSDSTEETATTGNHGRANAGGLAVESG